MPAIFNDVVPATAKEAWEELLEIVTRMGNRGLIVDHDGSVKDSYRASMLLGRLEMSAELGGFWKGSEEQ